MTTIILIVHMMIAVALVGVILLQRSEGGALGIGGGGVGGLMTGRASANLLTRTTAVLAAGFIATSLSLAILATHQSTPRSILDQPAPSASQTPGQTPSQAPAEAQGQQGQAPAGSAPSENKPAEPAAPSAPVAD